MENRRFVIGKEMGLMLCHDCHAVIEQPTQKAHIRCPRCLAAVHFRKPNSLNHTWALVITAFLLLFPANMLPIMRVDYLGSPDYSTIMDGIIYFFKEGSYGIGAIILTASVLVPVFKIVGIMMILLSIHFRWETWLRHKTLMFRFIKFIGRWSMLDIFVIALLTVLVQFGFFSTIQAASAAPYFLGVVVSTMLAAEKFDTRFIWDVQGGTSEEVLRAGD
ncbi:MAG TPA: paraquat-inducible membrane protein A [Deltaproteobacteria bacterium]|nr:paraquat-inducible membrane protein A [Deltaproteobacteria bacterium]